MSFSVTLDGEAHNNMKKVTTWCILSKCHSGQTFVIIAIEKNPHIMASCSVMILFCCFNHTFKKKNRSFMKRNIKNKHFALHWRHVYV